MLCTYKQKLYNGLSNHLSKMRWYFLILLFAFCYPNSVNALIFSEVMYDFPGTDAKHEWLEVYNDQNYSLNLSEIILREGNSNHQLHFIQGQDLLNYQDYAIITDDASTFLLD